MKNIDFTKAIEIDIIDIANGDILTTENGETAALNFIKRNGLTIEKVARRTYYVSGTYIG